MSQSDLSSLYERFQVYMDKCALSLRLAGLEAFCGTGRRHLEFTEFCRFWSGIESSPSLKREWLIRLGPSGFETETAMIADVLAAIPAMRSSYPIKASADSGVLPNSKAA